MGGVWRGTRVGVHELFGLGVHEIGVHGGSGGVHELGVHELFGLGVHEIGVHEGYTIATDTVIFEVVQATRCDFSLLEKTLPDSLDHSEKI